MDFAYFYFAYFYFAKRGDKFFELSNDHLGNVLATISENPNTGTRSMYLSYLFVQDVNAEAVVEDFCYVADVKSYSDYMPFGMQMPNRNGSTGGVSLWLPGTGEG